MARKKQPSQEELTRIRREASRKVLESLGMPPEELAAKAERFRRTANPPHRMSPDLHNALWVGNRLN